MVDLAYRPKSFFPEELISRITEEGSIDQIQDMILLVEIVNIRFDTSPGTGTSFSLLAEKFAGSIYIHVYCHEDSSPKNRNKIYGVYPSKIEGFIVYVINKKNHPNFEEYKERETWGEDGFEEEYIPEWNKEIFSEFCEFTSFTYEQEPLTLPPTAGELIEFINSVNIGYETDGIIFSELRSQGNGFLETNIEFDEYDLPSIVISSKFYPEIRKHYNNEIEMFVADLISKQIEQREGKNGD